MVDARYFFSKLTLDSMKLPRMNKELKCLSEAIYFESRGEQLEGQIAVADVIINRKNSRYFPNTICKVVSEGSHKRHACQFSYNCDGKLETISDKIAYRRAVKLSAMLLRGAFGDITDGATFFHASEVNPSWAKKFKKTKKIGRHIFYKR
jgi:spore germination cell wall hydrolase CwlJ-like protein